MYILLDPNFYFYCTLRWNFCFVFYQFTLSELEDLLHLLKDTAPGDDTVCYSMIKNTSLATRHLFLLLIQQSFSEGRTCLDIGL